MADCVIILAFFPQLIVYGVLYVIIFVTIASANRSYYNDVIMSAMASRIANHTIVYSTVYSVADQRKYLSFLAFV